MDWKGRKHGRREGTGICIGMFFRLGNGVQRRFFSLSKGIGVFWTNPVPRSRIAVFLHIS
jgi:hypothetical protein